MKAPPLLLGAALVFWGWQTGLLWLGLLAALPVAGCGWFKTRWAFSQTDLDRAWNLCVALFVGALLYAFVSSDSLNAVNDLIRENSPSNRLATLNQSKQSLFHILQWLPLIFLPIALAQLYGEQAGLDWSTFSWWLRRRRGQEPGLASLPGRSLNLTYPYFACCLLSASATNQRTLWFPAGLTVLVTLALWFHRSAAFGRVRWFSSLGLALGLALGAQFGLLELQKLAQRLDEALLAKWSRGSGFDARQVRTRIGAIGRLKLSGRIVLRVQTEGQPPPQLLQEAAFNLLRSTTWSAAQPEYGRVEPGPDPTTWNLHAALSGPRSVSVAGYLHGGAGALPVPAGAVRLEDLPAGDVTTNLFGSVRVEDGPAFYRYRAAYQAGRVFESPPGPSDLDVPPPERAAVSAVARELKLDSARPDEALSTIKRFFAERFTYSTWQDAEHMATRERTALARFLLENRSGHCEYFATATVLLLRKCGVPARYAVGYAVQEKKGQYYVVRERHAHAWCLAWLSGGWQEVDTTPPDWAKLEGRDASVWEPVRDAFSRLWFEISKWRWGHTELKRYLPWFVVPVILLTAGRLLAGTREKAQRPNRRAGAGPGPGADSEFYTIEMMLAEAGLGRQPGETGSAWLERIGRTRAIPIELLPQLLPRHYRLRFAPEPLGEDERVQFRDDTEAWSRLLARKKDGPTIRKGRVPPRP